MVSKSARLNMLQAQYDVVQAQNIRLVEENNLLRARLDNLTKDTGSNAATNVEARIMAMKMEDERDNMYENLHKLKKKYNVLHDAYLEKIKRCKALEETFKRQKTLTGLVMRSPIDQRLKEQQLAQEQRASENLTANLEMQVAKLNTDLDEAYDIIDELEFELESIDFLEMENQRLQTEIRELKKAQKTEMSSRRPSIASSECEQCSSCADTVDASQLERAAVTETLIQTAEAESNCLRRELLRSRLQKALRAKPPPPPPPSTQQQ